MDTLFGFLWAIAFVISLFVGAFLGLFMVAKIEESVVKKGRFTIHGVKYKAVKIEEHEHEEEDD